MRASQYFLPTLKETPADAVIKSHQLMLRASMIRKLSSGIYAYLPLGLRVLNKVANIIREEMNRTGALEMLMPTIQPAELWIESQRWEQYGSELLQITDRHQHSFCYGPTHEEVITHIVRNEVRSYKQLPLIFYQIQTKFRDEIRPRFGVMRAREFLMKDAYSFHLNQESLQQTYDALFAAYSRIFTRLGLKFRPVLADTGSIGGNVSHEFHVLADTGEDVIAYSDQSDYAANVERAENYMPNEKRPEPSKPMETVVTPGQKTIEAISQFLNVDPKQTVKTLLVRGIEHEMVALVLRGDHQLNEIKAAKLPQLLSPLQFVNPQNIQEALHCSPGSIGPVALNLPMIVDYAAAQLADFVCGANQDDKHLINVNWERDVKLTEVADLRNIVAGDVSPDGKGTIQLVRGIEVGHIFQLGDKYSKSMGANVLGEDGKPITLEMGCYGIGVSRIVAAAIEQHNDERGIIWPEAIAPFQIIILPMNLHKSYRVKEVAETIYQQLIDLGYEVLLDDRRERPGVMFANADLIGIPHQLIIGERGLDKGMIEYKARTDQNSKEVKLDGVVALFSSNALHLS